VACEEEIQQLGGALRAYAIRATGNVDLAEDLVQETAVAALAGTFDGRSTLRTWLIGILSHKIMDHFRRRKRTPYEGEVPDDLLDPGPSPEDRASSSEALAHLAAALPKLPEDERMAVLLVDVEGVDRKEVCNVLGVQPTHLRVLLHRGRHKLRRSLIAAGL
jgi:RNA polymerase sigma-70 factor (ECF subfamily)